MTEKSGKEVPDPLRGVDGVHSHVVQCRTGIGSTEGIGDKDHFKVKPGAVRGKDELDHVCDLAPGSVWPVLARNVETRQAPDNEPVLVVSVLHPIIKLSVNGHLAADLLLKSSMTILKVGHAVFVMADLFLNKGQSGIGTSANGLEDGLGLVEQM